MTGAAQYGALHPPASRLRFALHEAAVEFRFGLRSGLVALVFLGLTAYLLLILSNAGYMRDMNAADVPRNAPMLVYLLTPGDSLFLFFAWAWVFAQPVMRDRQTQLHEVVLAAPVPLTALLAGRWLGAWALALLLGASQMLGFVLAPLLEVLGMVPAGAMGPTPWAALAWAWLVYIVPLSAGCGALYLLAALRTRSAVGPFGVAALLCVAWMLAVVVIKDGHISPFLGALVDPSGFGEAERQVLGWTPHEKATALITITPGFALNRVLWCVLPLVWMAWALWHARREPLALEAPAGTTRARGVQRHAQAGAVLSVPPLAARQPVWWRALAAETAWQLQQVLRTRAAWIGGALLVFTGVVGGFFHVVAHAEGPMVPRPELLGPLLLKFTFLVIVFLVAALAGGIARRDDRQGFGEILDAAPVPIALRFAAKALAVAVVALLLVQLVAVSALITTAIAAPRSLDPAWPVAYQALVHLPALLEVAALVMLVHAVVRHAGLAHAASMLVAFVLIVNQETALVSYPLYKIGIPAKVDISGAGGWGPWYAPLLASDSYKLCVALVVAAIAGLLVVRGTDGRAAVRGREAVSRLRGSLGMALVLGAGGLAGLGALLQDRFVVEGGWRSPAAQRSDDAAWERRWWSRADAQGAYTATGGTVDLAVDLAARRVQAVWQLHGVQAPRGWLHAELPEHFTLQSATVDGRPVLAEVADEHLALPLGACAVGGCSVELRWQVAPRGWPADGEPPWLQRDALWLRASDVLPRLGLDGDRRLRVPSERREAGLAATLSPPGEGAAVAEQGIAPAGDWTWRIEVAGAAVPPPGAEGRTQGALDFAVAVSPRMQHVRLHGMDVAHDPTRTDTARAVADDVQAMGACVARRLGVPVSVQAVVQAPRGLGDTRLAGGLLWLPEQPGWDVADAGVGRFKRRADIARALAARQVADAAGLRRADGAQWLSAGLPGAVGLLCLADADGAAALQSVLVRAASEATQALSASTEPVGALARAGTQGWVRSHAPLAALDAMRRLDPLAVQRLLAAVRGGAPVAAALAGTLGPDGAALALGMPLASDLHVAADGALSGPRWRWQAGAWQPMGVVEKPWALGIPGAPGGVLYLDAWPGYERAPSDNAAP